MTTPVIQPLGERVEWWANNFIQSQIKGPAIIPGKLQQQATTAAEKANAAFTVAQRPPMVKRYTFSIRFLAVESSQTRLYGIFTSIIVLFLNLILLLGGIGLVALKPWGYRTTWWVCWAKLAMIVFFLVVMMTWILPIQLRDMRKQLDATFMAAPGGAPPPMMLSAATAAMSTSGVVLFALLAAIYPILLLVQLRKPRVKVACFQEESVRGGVSWD